MLPEKSGLKYSGFESFKKFRAKVFIVEPGFIEVAKPLLH